jgi:lysophospholipase L1-like esterase
MHDLTKAFVIRRRLSTMIAVTAVLCSLLVSAGPMANAGSADPVYSLALGDSLAVGFHPGRGETERGYVDMLVRRIRKSTIPDLALRNVACPGETTRSMITGERSPCAYPAGSQLQAAVNFLTAHPGDVAYVTIDIGANDLLNRCLKRSGLIERSCATDLAPHLEDRVTQIVDALSSAAGPDVPILGMNYYNPFLGLWGLVPGGRRLAHADQRAWTVFIGALATAYAGAGATLVDIATRFHIDDFDTTVIVPGRGRIPLNVALACRWTWFCSERFFGDPHADRTGYRRIANVFERELEPLLVP